VVQARGSSTWFKKDTYGLTIGGGQINHPGRYLVPGPPINGETASSAAISAPSSPGIPKPVQGLGFVGELRLHAETMARVPREYDMAARMRPAGRVAAELIKPPGFGRSAVHQQRIGSILCRQARQYVESIDPWRRPKRPRGTSSSVFPDLRRDEPLIDCDIMVKF
jgi:hypothetical protein